MRKLIAALFLIITLGMAQGANAGPFEDGLAAAHRKDYPTALQILRPLAAQGNPSAQNYLGVMSDQGLGVPQDYKEAMSWYRKAAAQGNAGAQRNLGSLYREGRGVPKHYSEAMKWFRLASAQGDAWAHMELGMMYENGFGVPQDYVRAHMWYNLAGAIEGGIRLPKPGLEAHMTPQQIAQAQAMATRCHQSNYKNCD